MLHNPGLTKFKPMTMPHFIAWLEMYPREQPYIYNNSRICLARQYCDFVGESYLTKWAARNSMKFRNRMEWIAAGYPSTFGAALERAKQENHSIFIRIRSWFL
jgi:hypothetical protein